MYRQRYIFRLCVQNRFDLLLSIALQQDETTLFWLSHGEEKGLKLATVSRILPGQRTVSVAKDYLIDSITQKEIFFMEFTNSCCLFIGCFSKIFTSRKGLLVIFSHISQRR